MYPGQQINQQPVFQVPGVGAAQPQQSSNGYPVVLQVATVKQVEQAQVPPGGKALVLVANEPVIAMRTADSMGLTTTDYYHIEKFDPDVQVAHTTSGDYVTRAEFNQFVNSLRAPAETEEKV